MALQAITSLSFRKEIRRSTIYFEQNMVPRSNSSHNDFHHLCQFKNSQDTSQSRFSQITQIWYFTDHVRSTRECNVCSAVCPWGGTLSRLLHLTGNMVPPVQVLSGGKGWGTFCPGPVRGTGGMVTLSGRYLPLTDQTRWREGIRLTLSWLHPAPRLVWSSMMWGCGWYCLVMLMIGCLFVQYWEQGVSRSFSKNYSYLQWCAACCANRARVS